jgi:hypothetical protein
MCDVLFKHVFVLVSVCQEVLRLERELMQQKSRNKVLQAELENPLNVHR